MKRMALTGIVTPKGYCAACWHFSRSTSISASVKRSNPIKRLLAALTRISSSSFACTAAPSRFCVAWIRNTIMNVTIVVAVLMNKLWLSDQP